MDTEQSLRALQRGLWILWMLNHQGRLAVGGSTAMTQFFVGFSCNSVVLKLVVESAMGDGIKSLAEIEYQQVCSLLSIKSSR